MKTNEIRTTEAAVLKKQLQKFCKTWRDTDDTRFPKAMMTIVQMNKNEATINCGGDDHVLVASLAGMEWLQGKKVTYTLDITSLTKMTIRSRITPWNQHETIDGVATDGVTILMGTELDDWVQHVTLMNSDDSRDTH